MCCATIRLADHAAVPSSPTPPACWLSRCAPSSACPLLLPPPPPSPLKQQPALSLFCSVPCCCGAMLAGMEATRELQQRAYDLLESATYEVVGYNCRRSCSQRVMDAEVAMCSCHTCWACKTEFLPRHPTSAQSACSVQAITQLNGRQIGRGAQRQLVVKFADRVPT